MSDYRRGRSVVSALHVHLVFVTKYRRGVFSERALGVLRQAFAGVCGEYPPTVQLSKLVNSLKGVSSRRLRKQGFPEVTAKLWGGRLWSPSYLAASCGGAPLDIVRRYIEGQRA